MGDFFLREVNVLFYGLTFWRSPKSNNRHSISFSYYKNNQDTFLFLGLAIALFLELGIFHILLLKFWPEYLWIFFWFGVSAIFYMLGLWASFKMNPIILEEETLSFNWGLNISQTINLTDIKTIKTGVFKEQSDDVLSLKYMAIPNVEMTFKSPLFQKRGLKGIERYSGIAFYADDPPQFKSKLFDKIGKN